MFSARANVVETSLCHGATPPPCPQHEVSSSSDKRLTARQRRTGQGCSWPRRQVESVYDGRGRADERRASELAQARLTDSSSLPIHLTASERGPDQEGGRRARSRDVPSTANHEPWCESDRPGRKRAGCSSPRREGKRARSAPTGAGGVTGGSLRLAVRLATRRHRMDSRRGEAGTHKS